jgi:hypothetical protein
MCVCVCVCVLGLDSTYEGEHVTFGFVNQDYIA